VVISNSCCRKIAAFSFVPKMDFKELGNSRRRRSVEKQRGATVRIE
jgi:hypothetical protein